MNEKYVPKQEEINQAEELMGNAQKELSKDRETMNDALEKMGKTGYLETITDNRNTSFDRKMKIIGTINGHLIDISRDYGNIDGKDITTKQARSIFEKFCDIAIKNDKIIEAQEKGEKESINLLVEKILN